MSTEDSFIMDDRFDDRWRSDIVESYFEHLPTESKLVSLQRRDSSQPPSSNTQSSMLTAPSLEKTDSQWSPMSSGLVTPLDSIGYWSLTPDSRRRSGRFSADSSGLYGQSNRWSLGTQLSNVSFTELPAQVTECDDKMSGDKIQEWNTIEKSDFEQDDNNIFHPDDEIILDPKESSEAPIKRASIGTRAQAQEWPIAEPLPKPIPSIEPRFRRLQPLTLPTNPAPLPSKNDRQSHKNSICETPIDTELSYSRRTSSYSFCSDAPAFKYPSYDPSSLPKVTNRLSFVESPPEMFNSESSWPLTASTTSTQQSNLWSVVEKSLPPTPRSRGVSISAPRREEYPPRTRMSANYDTIRASSLNFADRPASWNPRYDQTFPSAEFDLNLDRAILGTSLARDHRMARREEESSVEEQQQLALESIFNTLKLSESPSNRSSMTNGFRDNRNYTWTNDDTYRNDPREYNRNEHPRSSLPPPMKEAPLTEAQRQRNVMNRIVNERGLNPSQFDTSPKHARYFVIKSYNEDDVHKSLKFNIWASTEIGNRRLDKAYRESSRSGPIYLFFSVNASGQFCGMARMMSPVDYTTSSSVWTQTDKWKGRMDVRWIFVKDIPNSQLRHIRVWNNENKPVTNSRDTQELPPDAGLAMLRIFCDYPPKTSVILSNLVSAEMKEEMKEEMKDDNRTSVQSMDSRHASLPSIEGNRHTSMDANRLSNLQSVDEVGQYNHRHSLQSDEYSRQPPADIFPQRQSYQSSVGTDDMRRQSYQMDMHDYNRDSRDHIRNGPNVVQNPLNRRNTIGTTGPIGSTNRIVSSATPTSGMRSHDNTFPNAVAPRYHDTSNHRSMLPGFASLGEVYTSHRYPPFHDRTTNGHPRYDEEVRYF